MCCTYVIRFFFSNTNAYHFMNRRREGQIQTNKSLHSHTKQRRIQEPDVPAPWRKAATTTPYVKAWPARGSWLASWAKPLALAKPQNKESSPVIIKAEARRGDLPLKTHSLRCRQIVQAPKMIKEFNPLWARPLIESEARLHQSSKEISEGWGAKAARPTRCNRKNQNCLAKTHPTSKWSLDSSTWSQSKHKLGWGRFLLANLSAVQQHLWIANQRKKAHLVGAQVFQMRSYAPNTTDPWTEASYAYFVEYCPDVERRQKCLSGQPGCVLTFATSSLSRRKSSSTDSVRCPCKSWTHLESVEASTTVLLLGTLFGTNWNSLGAKSSILCPCTHLSNQNKDVVPSPISVAIAMSNNHCGIWPECIWKDAQDLSGSVFLSHNHCTWMPNSDSGGQQYWAHLTPWVSWL
jgi:hypothetical protein